jgi:FkbM family methyltransferase
VALFTKLRLRLQLLRHKPSHWLLRPDTIDRRLFRDVVLRNEYQLPARFEPADVILDIGAHTGSFSYAALRRGAGMVHCCEADPDNFRLLQHNLEPFQSRVRLSCCAVWRSDQFVTRLPFHNLEDPRNTGAGCVATSGSKRLVPALSFDELVVRATREGQRIRLVKLDCEGSEWPILLTSRTFHLVDALCGEYHLGSYAEPFTVAGCPDFTPALLEEYLTEQGFRVRMRPSARNPHLGLFFGERVS